MRSRTGTNSLAVARSLTGLPGVKALALGFSLALAAAAAAAAADAWSFDAFSDVAEIELDALPVPACVLASAVAA